jgi:hypothetical protein
MTGLQLAQPKAAVAAPGLSQARIAAFWLPLAASWLLMALEGPITNGTLARLPNPAVNIAAFGITMSLAITIESPVIMLLATTTALARDTQAYAKLKRFTLALMAITTAGIGLVAWSPLYDLVVRQAIGAPGPIADAAQPGLRIMLFWSAVIAWRRFRQGVLIRHGLTRLVGYGTVIRMAATFAGAVGLALLSDWPGVWVGAAGLMAGVIAEMVFIQIVTTPVVKRIPAPADRAGEANPEIDLSYRAIVGYHVPLAATSLLLLFTQPIIGAALARTPHPEGALAAWPVVSGLLFIFRSPGLAIPEVGIALLGERGAAPALRRFCLTVGACAAAVFVLMAFTPLAGLYLTGVIGLEPGLAAIAIPGIQVALAIPFLITVQGWLRGRLMHLRVTPPITLAMFTHLATLGLALTAGVAMGLPGVPMAAVSLTLAMMVEASLLAWQSRRLHIRA